MTLFNLFSAVIAFIKVASATKIWRNVIRISIDRELGLNNSSLDYLVKQLTMHFLSLVCCIPHTVRPL